MFWSRLPTWRPVLLISCWDTSDTPTALEDIVMFSLPPPVFIGISKKIRSVTLHLKSLCTSEHLRLMCQGYKVNERCPGIPARKWSRGLVSLLSPSIESLDIWICLRRPPQKKKKTRKNMPFSEAYNQNHFKQTKVQGLYFG